MGQVCFLVDAPIGRAEICERAGIPTSSYDRHISELAALMIMESHTVEGRRKWTAHLEPWWTPGSSTSSPHGDKPSLSAGGTPWESSAFTRRRMSRPPDVAVVLEQVVGLEHGCRLSRPSLALLIRVS